MLKFLVAVALLFAVALGFVWLKNTSGEVALTFGDTAYAVDLTTAAIGLIAAFAVAVALLWFVQEILYAPTRMALGWRRRKAEQGRAAISRGLIAVAAGDLRTAERAMLEASRRTPDQPLARLLQAQTAQLKGDRVAARTIFQEMTEDRQTRIAGLRGLYIEAEREGEHEAAHQIADRAREEAPSAPWAARALLRHQTAARDWDAALRTLSGAADGRILDKRTMRRQRAVLLAAKAIDLEAGDPDTARPAAMEAHELAPELVPAAVVAGRLLARQGDIRRATRVLEATWKAAPHPEVADAYLHVRAGDSAADRLRRAEALARLRPQADEGRIAVARAALDARDFSRAREALTPVLTTRPTQRTLILMAEFAERETGDQGRAREWMARAVRAPRDPAWTADGMVLEAWAPASPVTGRLDAVEWKVPVAELESPRLEIDAAELQPALLTSGGEGPDAVETTPPVEGDWAARFQPSAAAGDAGPGLFDAAEAPLVDGERAWTARFQPSASPGAFPAETAQPDDERAWAARFQPVAPREPFPAELLGAGSFPERAAEPAHGDDPAAADAVADAAPAAEPVAAADPAPVPQPAMPAAPGPVLVAAVPTRADPPQPPIPDDPGVSEADPPEQPVRRFRIL